MRESNEIGVLIIAHGSRNPHWVQRVEEVATTVRTEHPLTVGYLELVEGKSIADGVRRLEGAGVERIVAVPLFVSSGSTHLEEIQYALGVKPVSRVETDLEFIHPRVPVAWAKAMDDHPLVVEILADRIRTLSRNPQEETLLLVAHGSEKPGFRPLWEKGLSSLTAALQERYAFDEADFAMLRLGDVRQKAERLSRQKECVTIPVFVSPGYFTEEVVTRELKGLPCRYRGETFLPHPLVARWVEAQIEENLRKLAVNEHFSGNRE